MKDKQRRIILCGVLFCVALAVEAMGIVFFLDIDSRSGILRVRTISPYWLLVGWAMMKTAQGFAVLLWIKYSCQ